MVSVLVSIRDLKLSIYAASPGSTTSHRFRILPGKRAPVAQPVEHSPKHDCVEECEDGGRRDVDLHVASLSPWFKPFKKFKSFKPFECVDVNAGQ
jgi:hypothetical protein